MKLIENERINKNILNSLNKLNESIDKESLKHTILSKVFSYYPDIDEETEDYFIGLSLEELISEVKNFGWSDILDDLEDELKELDESDNQEVKNVLNIEDGSDEDAALDDIEARNLKDEFNSLKPKTKKLYKDLLPINPEIHMSHKLADEYAKMYNIDSALLLWLANIGRHMDNLEESFGDSTKTKKYIVLWRINHGPTERKVFDNKDDALEYYHETVMMLNNSKEDDWGITMDYED